MPATPNAPTQLPPVGAEIPCSCYAANVPLKIHALEASLEFKGQIKVSVQINPNEPPHESVLLKVTGHEVTADHPDFGRITITQNDTAVTPASLLQVVRAYPQQFSATMYLSFTLTIENPPQQPSSNQPATRSAEPLVLRTKNPAVLHNPNLTDFPPNGAVYKLQNPIELVLPDNPDSTVASIDKFPVQVGDLS